MCFLLSKQLKLPIKCSKECLESEINHKFCTSYWNIEMGMQEFLLWLSRLRTQLVSVRMRVWSLASLSGLRIWCCYELCIGCRCGSDSTLLWLRCRPAAAASIRPQAWELPYAAGSTLKSKKKEKPYWKFPGGQAVKDSVLSLLWLRLLLWLGEKKRMSTTMHLQRWKLEIIHNLKHCAVISYQVLQDR